MLRLVQLLTDGKYRYNADGSIYQITNSSSDDMVYMERQLANQSLVAPDKTLAIVRERVSFDLVKANRPGLPPTPVHATPTSIPGTIQNPL